MSAHGSEDIKSAFDKLVTESEILSGTSFAQGGLDLKNCSTAARGKVTHTQCLYVISQLSVVLNGVKDLLTKLMEVVAAIWGQGTKVGGELEASEQVSLAHCDPREDLAENDDSLEESFFYAQDQIPSGFSDYTTNFDFKYIK